MKSLTVGELKKALKNVPNTVGGYTVDSFDIYVNEEEVE